MRPAARWRTPRPLVEKIDAEPHDPVREATTWKRTKLQLYQAVAALRTHTGTFCPFFKLYSLPKVEEQLNFFLLFTVFNKLFSAIDKVDPEVSHTVKMRLSPRPRLSASVFF